MTPLPEVSPSADALHDPLFAARFSAAVVDAVTIALRFVRFFPSLAFLFSLFFPPFWALLYSPAGEIGPGLFSFRVYLISRAPHNCPSFLLSSAVFLSPRPPCYPLSLPVHPFLCPGTSRGSGSQVTLKNLADGRKIGDTYIIHCVSRSLSFLPQRSVSRGRTCMYLTNCSRSYRPALSYNILQRIRIIYFCTYCFIIISIKPPIGDLNIGKISSDLLVIIGNI